MKSAKLRSPVKKTPLPAFTLTGTMRECSSTRLHAHTHHQILTIRNGVTLLEDENGTHPQYGHMCAFLPAGVPHRSVVIGEPVVYQSLYISPRLLPRAEKTITIFTARELSSALFNFCAMETTCIDKGTGRNALRLFLEVVSSDIRSAEFSFSLPRPKSVECAKVTGFIEKNFARKISISDFGSVLPFTPRHITRLFREEMRITPYEYVRLYRIFSASVALRTKERKIIEIAYSCGYESLSSFYTDFNKYFGQTPKIFRQNMIRSRPAIPGD
jgi:AraC-like DNA-binding protein